MDELISFIHKEISRYEIDFMYAKKNDNRIEMFYNEGAINSLKDILEHLSIEKEEIGWQGN